MSVWKILKREGISHPGQATMEEFKSLLDHSDRPVVLLSKERLGHAANQVINAK